jgi:uncharacterized protein (TIGR00730 family)
MEAMDTPASLPRQLCVFCGSSDGANPRHRQAAVALGASLARRGIGLVYGGAHCGLMGALADAVLEGGGRVVGVMPQALVQMERAHEGLSELIITPDMHTRKAKMSQLADAFLALPGGFGTLDELCEIVTWAQLGFHRKPIGILNSDGFWDGLLTFLAHGRAEGFIPASNLALLQCHGEPEGILDLLYQGTPVR